MSGDYAAAREMLGGDMGMHVVLARVEKVTLNVTGQYADCIILENEDPILAKDAPALAGAGFGIFRKLPVGAVVVILCSGGNPDGQNVIVGVLPNNKSGIPTEAIAAPDDFWLVMASGKNIQFKATGAGKIILNGNAKVTGDMDVDGDFRGGTVHAANGSSGPAAVYNTGIPGQLSAIEVTDGVITTFTVI